MAYEKLFEPGKIGSMTIKNRGVMMPMATDMADKDGIVTPLTDPVSATCYRTGCTIRLDYTDGQLSAHVETKTPKPTGSTLPHEVDLKATVAPNTFGGIHIQHTGSCGESTTMLHHLDVSYSR